MQRLHENKELLDKITALLDTANITADRELAADMMMSVLKFAHDEPGRGDMKLMARSTKELRYAMKVFKRYRQRRKVSVFGSARTETTHPNYVLATEFGKLLAKAGFMVITGAGGGIMAAGNEGAGKTESFGVAIKLPFEQKTNEFIEGDEKLIHFRYFFSRKLVFVKETHAIALFPGGFGTHDEGFEVLTLVQTGRCDPLPIVLLEEPGGTYWKSWDDFIKKELLEAGLISPEDLHLYHITYDAAEAVRHIQTFYRNYHSCRYHKDELVLRVKQAPTPAELDKINADFGFICTSGKIESRPPPHHDEETLVPDYARVVLKFDRRSLGHLRLLIDRLNALPSLPPMDHATKALSETHVTSSDRNLSEIAEEESVRLVEP
ncbi:MAG: TIGR00730 family Rossman fold protein [Phycisphaerales bacterium]|nr:TIGR00730 family Rossman fold protein [Phycisphaerales bacterium]